MKICQIMIGHINILPKIWYVDFTICQVKFFTEFTIRQITYLTKSRFVKRHLFLKIYYLSNEWGYFIAFLA